MKHSNDIMKLQPRMDIDIRVAEADGRDFEFIDALQKQHSNELGFMQRKALESYIAGGDVLIAQTPPARGPDGGVITDSRGVAVRGVSLGYCIGRDRYFKREDVGVIYQLAIAPGKKRSLIGAALVQAMFERAAYGCRLFCCWCAQDIDANEFWEAIGFVPLAFRTGSRGRQRTHIFWQKRIRVGDEESSYWFPSQTSGGALREDRLVLPIPPGTHWRDAKPLVLPGTLGESPGDRKSQVGSELETSADSSRLPPAGSQGRDRVESKLRRRRERRRKKTRSVQGTRSISSGGLWFAHSKEEQDVAGPKPKKQRAKKKKRSVGQKNDPKYVAAARELRDRYLEELQRDPSLLDGGGSGGKYDVSRQVEGRSMDDGPINFRQVSGDDRLLDAA